MRNLELWDISIRDLGVHCEDKAIICHGRGDGGSSSDVYLCGNNLILSNFNELGQKQWAKDISIHISRENRPIGMTYLSLQNSLNCGFENGELLSICDLGTTYNTVGIFNSGLLTMGWSPDQELLALVTKDLNAVLLSCSFDPVHEVNLLDEEFGEKQFITVGWGKKETQFHGSQGKQAARATEEVYADPDVTTDEKVTITWRGDGAMYAIGFAMNGLRRFKVFDREGHLQFTSEKIHGLEANVAWRPSGNVIATTQRVDSKCNVTFFEKNGLKHGEFNVKIDSTTKVENLYWSFDSEILTLQCKDTKTNKQKLLLYTTSNYHWYLKQTLEFRSDQRINKIMWDNDFDITNSKKVHIILQNGSYFTYSFVWNINLSKGLTESDDALVNVIDGSILLLTGFRHAVVPPPMASFHLELNTCVNYLGFAPRGKDIDPNSFFIFTTDNRLIFFKQTQKCPLNYEALRTLRFEDFDFPFQYHHWYWIDADTMICIMVDDKSYYLIEYSIASNTFVKNSVTRLPAGVTRIEHHPRTSSIVYLQLINGDILAYTIGIGFTPKNESFKMSCAKFGVFFIENTLHFIGLSHKGHLYIDDKIILTNASSFFVHTEFLLLTTLQHLLLCIEINPFGFKALLEFQATESNVYKRKIERGAKLVTIVPNDTRAILQLPRGNIETLQPRPLSLKIIAKYLDSLKYHEAFDLMRKQRINLNLIYDHNPQKFLENIDLFLDSIKNMSWLNLFLSELENTDVTKSMYAQSYPERSGKTAVDSSNKIDLMCNLFREHITKREDKATMILPLLTTYVKKNTTEELEKALSIILDLKSKETNGDKVPVGSDEALKYLLYMVDVNQLFDISLGMYNFDLVLLVANKSQKDPKEYIPMLNELNEMDENYRRFTINKHLKRFDKAVDALVLCGPQRHGELRIFVKFHSLYQAALSQFTPDEEIFKQISEDYGLHLKLKKYHTEAGIVYERASNNDKAVECYKDGLEWEMAIKLAYSWPKQQIRDLCWDLVQALKEGRRHAEALTILEQYYGDPDEVLTYAIEHSHYKTALRVCVQYRKDHLKEKLLLPAVMEEQKNLLDLIETNWNIFIRHRTRLLTLRDDINKQDTQELYDAFNVRDTDLYSDAGSTLASSKGSSRTYKSSKNRRKQERKIGSLKEGSQFEDVGLIMALHTLIMSSFELRTQIKDLAIVLSSLNKQKEAALLQKSLEKLLNEMKDSFKDIWTDDFLLEAATATIAAQSIPEGSSIIPPGIASLDSHIKVAPAIKEINWKLEGIN